MKKITKEIIFFTALIIILTTIFYISNYSSPETIVQTLGIQNSYLVLFFISFFGGFSSGGSVLFMTTLATFVAGGLNFATAGITAGIALAIGDTIMLSLFHTGRKLIPKKTQQKLNKLSHQLNQKPKYIIPIIAFIYIALTPLPNDLIILSLAAINYEKRKSILLLILGDITFTILYSFLVMQGISLLI